jgi:hypothetical protein
MRCPQRVGKRCGFAAGFGEQRRTGEQITAPSAIDIVFGEADPPWKAESAYCVHGLLKRVN